MEHLQTTNPELFSSIRRHFHSLHQPLAATRKNSLNELLQIIKQQQLSPSQFDQITQMGLKDVLKCFADSSQQCRQTAITLLIAAFTRCSKISSFLPYVYSTLIDRTNCVDLEGIANIPEKMRPAPGQKPKVLSRLNQSCEEIRVQYCRLMEKLFSLSEETDVRKHIQDIVNILRALVMDPAPDIQRTACDVLRIFCNCYKHLLLHYTEIMGRAILLPLIGKKSKVRIAALNALTAVLWCGLWKYNAFIFQNLIGFRDPNSVPIKDFYQPSNNINYFATLTNDPNNKIRQQFMKHVKIWVCDLDDRYDHHGRLVPYLLSGLFDSDSQVKNLAVSTIVQIGKQMEVEKEQDFRENKQFAIDAAWTWDGQLTTLPLIQPIFTRPSLGSRFFIRGHVRKFWTALYKEIKDINYNNRIRAAYLALYGVIFTQHYLTQYVDVMIPQLLLSLIPRTEQDCKVSSVLELIFKYIGRYCESTAYTHIIKSALQGQFVANEHFIKAAMKALACLIQGSLQAVPPNTGLCHKLAQILNILSVVEECNLPTEVYRDNSAEGREIVHLLLINLKSKANTQELNQVIDRYGIVLFKLFACSYYEYYYSSCFINTTERKHQCNAQELIREMKAFSQCSTEFNNIIQQYLQNTYLNTPSVMDCDWKCSIVLLNYYMATAENNPLTQQVINQSINSNKTVQMLYFICKCTQYFLLQLPNCLQLKPYSKVLLSAFKAIQQFKVQRKVPIYDQHLQKQEEGKKINEDTFIVVFKCLSLSLQCLFSKQPLLDNPTLGQLLHSYLAIQSRFPKGVRSESIRTVWMVCEKAEVTKTTPEEMSFREADNIVCPLTEVVDFAIDKIETMKEPDPVSSNMLFGILQNVLRSWPATKEAKPTIPFLYKEYSTLLHKLIAYSLDEKDIELRSKYREILITICSKIKLWFVQQLQYCEENKRFAKAKIIKEVIEAC